MKTISIVNMKGGVAKTTLAINLASFLSERENKKVLLIDMDPQFNATQCLLTTKTYMDELKKGNSVSSIFERKARKLYSTVDGLTEIPEIELKDIKPSNISANLDLVIGDLDLYLVEMSVGSGKELLLKKYLTYFNGIYDYAIIDTPPTPSVWMTSSLIASDYYLVPVKPEPLSATGIDLLRRVIREKTENYDLKIECCGLIFTMVETRTINYIDTKKYFESDEYWGKHLYRSYMPKATEIARLQGSQKTILESFAGSAKHQMAQITREFLGRAI